MLYGSAFHEYLEKPAVSPEDVCAKWKIPHLEKELRQHATRALGFLKRWIGGDNIWDAPLKVLSKERHRASRILTLKKGAKTGFRVRTRDCDFEEASHHYDLQPGEFGGTSDMVLSPALKPEIIIVEDHKTGDYGEFHMPAELPQMRTLALQEGAGFVSILHAPRESAPTIYTDPIEPPQLRAHADALRKAMRRIGDGSLRPGPWCKRCPARESCPAKDGELLARAGAMVKTAIDSEALTNGPVDKGAFHMFLQELSRLDKRAREVLKADVKAGEIIARPDGKVLVIKEKEYESLSKSSIIAALGKVKGERAIERLRAQGCVKKETREELHAVDDK
jgi:hypothetical protein